MNGTGKQSEVSIPLNPQNSENGPGNPASEQRRPSLECSGRCEQNAARCTWKPSTKDYIIGVLASLLLIFIILYAVQCVNSAKQSQAMPASRPPSIASCPRGWKGNEGFCYFFSRTETTWDTSLSNCTSSGGSLLIMDTPQEMTFINKNKRPTEYWIGLRRDKREEPWKLPNNSSFNNWFSIKGDGLCASLNDGVVSSTDCDISHRCWICRKDLPSV